MPSNGERAYESLQKRIGEDEGTGGWFELTQDQINTFAEVTNDHQWIHVDPDRCAEMSPWKVPIAHGFLTLSMLTHLTSSIRSQGVALDGIVMGVNYGFDKVRFVSPVKVGSRIRACSVLADVTQKGPDAVQTKRTVTVEIEGEAKPALVAEWLTMLNFAG